MSLPRRRVLWDAEFTARMKILTSLRRSMKRLRFNNLRRPRLRLFGRHPRGRANMPQRLLPLHHVARNTLPRVRHHRRQVREVPPRQPNFPWRSRFLGSRVTFSVRTIQVAVMLT
jgi:hypothetical protein